MAMVSMAAGTLALVTWWIPVFGWAGVAIGLLGTGTGMYAITEPWKKSLAKAGLVTSMVAVAMGLLVQVPLTMAMLE